VFGAEDAMYVGEDGGLFANDTPPVGGIRIGPRRKQREGYAVAQASVPLPDDVAPEEIVREFIRVRGERPDDA